MTIFKSHLTAMSAYSPPLEGRDPAEHLLLDFNERTLPISEPIRRALIEYINGDKMQMYPSYGDLTARIAAYAGVAPAQVMLTNGSDQAIDLIIRSACVEGDEVIIPTPSFAFYKQCALVENVHIIEPEYSRSKGFPTAEVIEAITPKTRVIVMANPNNPSGTVVARENIITVAKAAPEAAVLVDECYFEYSGITVCDLVQQYPNILVTRTFSKTWGLPSIRLGYIVACVDNIRTLLNVRGPYDVNQLAVVAVRAALEYPDYTHNYVREVMEEAKPLLENYLEQANIDYWPSGANFLWIFPSHPERLAELLQKQGILVRPKAHVDGQLGLRMTLGPCEHTQRLIAALKKALDQI